MKVDSTKILLFALVLLMGYNSFFKTEPIPEPVPVTLTLPESFGSTGLQQLEPKVVVVQVPVSQGSQQKVDVDKIWKDAYEQANQRVKDSLYNEAIRIRTYSDTIVDNDNIMIKGDATTRGSMLDFRVDYKLKEKDFTYTPEIVTQYPKLTVGLGAEVGVPTVVGQPFTLKGNVDLMNKKGNEINLGYDTNQTVWLGYTYNFKLSH